MCPCDGFLHHTQGETDWYDGSHGSRHGIARDRFTDGDAWHHQLTVRPLPDASELAGVIDSAGRHLQTIGVAGFDKQLPSLAEEWGRLGASRIVPIREMSFPPPWWYHDGRGPLQDLVRWAEVDEG